MSQKIIPTPKADRVKPRTKELDYDARRDPKTNHYCCMCQKDLDPAKSFRWVHLVNGGMFALHPEDEANYVPDAGDMGSFLIGNGCAKKLGLEWTHPPIEKASKA